MTVFEVIGNFHMHTRYSDGEADHAEIAEAALRAGLDVVLVTDHNVWVDGPARYYAHDGQRVLMLVGEEVHDQTRQRRALDGLLNLAQVVQMQAVLAQDFAHRRIGRAGGQVEF